MGNTTAMVLRGPFTNDDFMLVVATIRQIDGRHPVWDTFEVVSIDSAETTMAVAEALLKQALPAEPDRKTTFRAMSRRELRLEATLRCLIEWSERADNLIHNDRGSGDYTEADEITQARKALDPE